MSDTPRTNAAEIRWQSGFNETGTGQVPIEACRKIERDLTECQNAGKHYRLNIERLQRELASLRTQLAERENWDRLRGEEARRLTNEIAEARRTRDVVLSANVNITMERDQIREQLAERDAELAALKGRLHEIAEEWAGAECGEPVTAQEAYAIGLCKRMYQLAVYPKEE